MRSETPVLVWTLQGLFCSKALGFCLVYNYRLETLFSENTAVPMRSSCVQRLRNSPQQDHLSCSEELQSKGSQTPDKNGGVAMRTACSRATLQTQTSEWALLPGQSLGLACLSH